MPDNTLISTRFFIKKALPLLIGLSIIFSGCRSGNQPFIKIGAMNKQFPSDAVCTLIYQKKRILTDLYVDNEFWMNLEGKDIKLLRTTDKNMYKFKNGNLEILLDYGPSEEYPTDPNAIGDDGNIFKNAKITFTRGSQTFSIQAQGGCNAGMDYGL